MPVKFKDYYEILGVSRTASQKDVNQAYRRLARKFHPDVNKEKGAEEKLKEINEAYEVLKDPDKRKRYDTLGANWRAGQDFSPPPGWGNVRVDMGQGGKGGAGGFDFGGMGGGFSEFFESLFGKGGINFGGFGGAQTAHAPGADVEAGLTISLEEACHGATKSISLQSGPNGFGAPPGPPKTYQVKIPPGLTEGSKIRLGGQGARGGDLYLKVHVAPHPRFRVKEHDLETDILLAPWEAALGAKANVPTLEGTVSMTVPAGTQGGQRLRLRGKGLPLRGDARGDLYAIIKIAVPKTLTPRERELFEELARHSPFKPRG